MKLYEGQTINIDGEMFRVIKIRHGAITIRETAELAPEVAVNSATWDESWSIAELKEWAEAHGKPVPYYITRKGDVVGWLAETE